MVTHWMVETDTWKSLPSVSRATATMVVSRIDMMEPRTTTVAIRGSSGVRTASLGTSGHGGSSRRILNNTQISVSCQRLLA